MTEYTQIKQIISSILTPSPGNNITWGCVAWTYFVCRQVSHYQGYKSAIPSYTIGKGSRQDTDGS